MKKLLILILTLICIDQLSKFIVIKKGNINVIPNVLTFEVIDNKDNSDVSYKIIDLFAIIVFYRYITSDNQFIKYKNKVVLSITVSAFASDFIDRIFRGHVVRFIKMLNMPALNLAYIYVIVSWIALAMILTKFTYDEYQKKKAK